MHLWQPIVPWSDKAKSLTLELWRQYFSALFPQKWRNWLRDAGTQYARYQLLIALLSGAVTALLIWTLPLFEMLEAKLFDLRVLHPHLQDQHPELIQVQVGRDQQEALLRYFETLPTQGVAAIGLDTPGLFNRKWLNQLAYLSQKKQLNVVLGVPYLRQHRHQQGAGLQWASSKALKQGVVVYPLDHDGHLRRVPLDFRYRTNDWKVRQQPSFVYQLYHLLEPQQAANLPLQPYFYLQKTTAEPPLDLKHLGQLQPAELKGKVLLFAESQPLNGGVAAENTQNSLQTHVKTLSQLLSRNYYLRPGLLNQLLPLLLIVLMLVLLNATLKWGLWVAAFSGLTLLLSYLSFNLLLMHHFFIWLDLIAPISAPLVAGCLVLFHFYTTEGRTRKQIFSTIRRHLPHDIARVLLEQQGDNLAQNERRVVTVMFTDIQGFSRMSEKLPTDQIIQILNEYLAAMTEIIFRNCGSLDKYIGDGIMAVYGNIGSNNPRQDACFAVKTALEMQNRMAELQKKWMDEGIRPIQIRIGIHTGEALVGHVGHPQHRQLTVIGDTVNTCARIEKLNKQYRTHILISHSTYEYVKDQAEVQPLGEEQLKGKSSSVMVYEVKGWKV